MQRRTAPLPPSLAVAFELDRAGFGQRVGRLLALGTFGPVDHRGPRTTSVHPRHLGRLQWPTPSVLPCCHPSAFGYDRKSRCQAEFDSAPERIRTSDLRFRRPTLYPAELRAQWAAEQSSRRQRRGRDSNPRWRFPPHTRLAGECLQPLGHLSGSPGRFRVQRRSVKRVTGA